jgi:hypothetical protein
LPDTFLASFNGGAWISSPALVILPGGNVRANHDLASLAPGNYTSKLKARCGTLPDSGESVPYLFTKPSAMAIPSGLSVVAGFLVSTEYIKLPANTDNFDLPNQFSVQINAGAWNVSPAQTMPSSNTRLNYDLSSLAPGNYTIKVRAKNILWSLESGDSLPFVYSKQGSPHIPTGIVIKP